MTSEPDNEVNTISAMRLQGPNDNTALTMERPGQQRDNTAKRAEEERGNVR